MARTGQQQATQAAATYAGQAQTANNQAQSDIGQFNKNVTSLQAGKDVAADPWQNPTYLANQNRLQSSALNASKDAADADISATNRRTGGLNTGASIAAKSGLALNKMRLANSLSAGRAAQDYNKNVGYQTDVAGLPLKAAGAEGDLYKTAEGGQTAADSTAAQFGLQSQNFWDQLAQMGAKAGTGFVLGGAPGALSTLGGGRG